MIDVCVSGFVPCTLHGNLGRFGAAGAEVALVADHENTRLSIP